MNNNLKEICGFCRKISDQYPNDSIERRISLALIEAIDGLGAISRGNCAREAALNRLDNVLFAFNESKLTF